MHVVMVFVLLKLFYRLSLNYIFNIIKYMRVVKKIVLNCSIKKCIIIVNNLSKSNIFPISLIPIYFLILN